MKKLAALKVVKPKVFVPKEEPKKKKENKSTLPPDTYKDEIEPLEVFIDESRKLVLSVKRGGDLGLPCVDVRQYVTTDNYEGFTKKGINFPLELLSDLIEKLCRVEKACEDKGLE